MKATKLRKEYTPIRYTLTLSFLSLIAFTLIVVSIIDFVDASEQLESHFEILMKQSEHNIVSAIELVDAGYQILETHLDREIQEDFVHFLNEYDRVEGDVSKIDLEKLKLRLGEEYDLYIIDDQGVIQYTTYVKDLKLDFQKKSPVWYKNNYTAIIRLGGKYVGGRISAESTTGELRKFAYFPTKDQKYVLELGLRSSKFEAMMNTLDMLQIAKQLKSFNHYLYQVRIFDGKAKLFGDPSYQATPKQKQLVEDVFHSKNTFVEEGDGKLTRYILANLFLKGSANDSSKIIELVYDTSIITAALQKKALYHFLFMIVAIMINTVVTLLISAWITTPIKKIIQDIDIIAQGDLKHPIETEAKNELKILKQSTQVMVGNLEEHIEHISHINKAYSYFVPNDFINLLEKEGILDIRLGDQVQKEMTVVFSDIRGFTALSESMTPKENFDFINSYLNFVGPVIRDQNGFIDKYIGDAIMALFPESADDALQAAVAIRQKLIFFNWSRRKKGLAEVDNGVGIHTGNLMLGIIGENERREATVISDAVNLASRIEGLTKIYKTPIIITEDTYNNLREPEQYSIRTLDRVKVKGRAKPIRLFEVINGDLPEIRDAKVGTTKIFNEALSHYQKQRFQDASELFRECYQKCPEDKVAQIYAQRCEKLKKNGVSKNWRGGVAVLNSK